MDFYSLIRPLFFTLAPETAHNLAISALRLGLVPAPAPYVSKTLSLSRFGLEFANPLGLAAGFDKNAACLKSLAQVGFGMVEAGTVTPRPQPGNKKPRLFRLNEDEAVINRMGFNNQGMEAFCHHLEHRPKGVVIGANIGKNKDTEDPIADYVLLLKRVYGLSDYITVNISSPNTPGLRDLQAKGAVNALLQALAEVRTQLATAHGGKRIPLLLKIAPDMEEAQQEAIAEAALTHHVDGLIISNTSIGLRESLYSRYAPETGGLSGKPIFDLSTRMLGNIYRFTEGKLPLIGVGGITSGEDAYEKIRHGACLIQVYSALIYHGFSLVPGILRGLDACLERDGFTQVEEAIGSAFA